MNCHLHDGDKLVGGDAAVGGAVAGRHQLAEGRVDRALAPRERRQIIFSTPVAPY